MYVLTVIKVYVCVPLYSAKGIDDVALRTNKKIKFVCLFVWLNLTKPSLSQEDVLPCVHLLETKCVVYVCNQY